MEPAADIYSKCMLCKHVLDQKGRTCAAFMDGIPLEIWNGEIEHDKPYPGDQGYRFEKKKG